jgi:hypothetical protein
MAEDQKTRVAVYFLDDDERTQAEAQLDDASVFANVMEGSVGDDGLQALVDAGLVVEKVPPSVPAAEARWSPDDAAVIADLEARAEPAGLATAPQLASDDGGSAAAADLVAEGDVHRIQMRGPITREQRVELDGLDVDIAAFDPPSSYRAFLTPEQHRAVEALDYVVAVTPYRFEEKFTGDLVTLVGEQASGQPALASDGPADDRRTFDCLVHREADLDRIRDLIAATDGVEVMATSNLRVRFSAPVDTALLSSLAALPQVRQLSVYHPTSLGGIGARR